VQLDGKAERAQDNVRHDQADDEVVGGRVRSTMTHERVHDDAVAAHADEYDRHVHHHDRHLYTHNNRAFSNAKFSE